LTERAALRLVTDPEKIEIAHRIVLEKHHVLGRANYPQLTICLCFTHHAIVSDVQRRGAVPMMLQTNPLERQIASQGNISALL
jgi:L-fucose isomerase-like protein